MKKHLATTLSEFLNETIVGLNKIKSKRGYDDNILYKIFKGDELKIKEYLKKIIKEIDQNITSLKFISSGAMGYAFLTNYDNVIKITMDKSEAQNSQYLTTKETKCFAKYYWVVKTQIDKYIEWCENSDSPTGKIKRGEYDYMFILSMEKLKMLDDYEKEIIWLLRRRFFETKENGKYCVGFAMCDLSYDEFQKINSEDKLKILYSYIKTNDINKPFEYKLSKYIENDSPINMTILSKLSYNDLKNMYISLMKIYKEGKELDIILSDLHSDNLGYNKNGLVAFDIGLSTNLNLDIKSI